MPTKSLQSKPRPAASYAEATDRIAALQARDTEAIDPVSRTAFLGHGQRVERAIVFFHGYTSSPAQFRSLGEAFFDLGCNVLIPRLPHHGMADRLTTDQTLLTAEELVAAADEALDIAQGLGEQATVAGLSMGGVMAGWAAQERADVARAILIAPCLGLHGVPAVLARPLTHVVLRMPNFWVQRGATLKGPGHGYPRFASHAMGQILRLSAAVRARAKRAAPATRSIVAVSNANDLTVDNRTTARLVALWRDHGAAVATYEFPADLLLPHDLIDPAQPVQKIDLVYPVLIELAQRR